MINRKIIGLLIIGFMFFIKGIDAQPCTGSYSTRVCTGDGLPTPFCQWDFIQDGIYQKSSAQAAPFCTTTSPNATDVLVADSAAKNSGRIETLSFEGNFDTNQHDDINTDFMVSCGFTLFPVHPWGRFFRKLGNLLPGYYFYKICSYTHSGNTFG